MTQRSDNVLEPVVADDSTEGTEYKAFETKEELKQAIELSFFNIQILSVTTTMINAFETLTDRYGPVKDWDVSQITDMSNLFYNMAFDQDISGWDVSNVTNMEAMFYMSEFNHPIGEWDVSNVTNMESMFSESKFNQDISQWNVNNVVHMSEMFYDSDFNNGDKPERLENWNIDLDYLTRDSTNNMFFGTLIEAGGTAPSWYVDNFT